MPENENDCCFINKVLSIEEVLKVVKAAAYLGIRKVRFTGGEPLVYKDIVKLIYETSKISGIEDVSITTNGILLGEMLEELIKAGLKRVNISLDTLSEEKFKYITKYGSLQQVMDSIQKCLEQGIKPVKLNTVLLKGINDSEINDFIKLTAYMPVDVRFIELMPIGEGVKFYDRCKLTYKEVLDKHSELIPIENMKQGTALMYKLENGKGRVGFINPLSCKFCSDCNKIRLTCDGKIKPCLHSEKEIDIKQYLQEENRLIEVLKQEIYNKPLEHHLEEENKSRSTKKMYQVGG